MNVFLLFQYALSFGFMGAASVSDLRTREVSNWVWVWYGVTASVFSAIYYGAVEPWNMVYYVLNAGLTVIVSLGLWFAGAFGGADSKALICVGLAHMSSLLVLAYTVFLVVGMQLVKKKSRVPAIPLMTLSLGFALIMGFFS